jgi:hypothetical protein
VDPQSRDPRANAEAEYFLREKRTATATASTRTRRPRADLAHAERPTHGQYDARVELAEEILTSKEEARYKTVATWVRPGRDEGASPIPAM